MIFVRNNTQKNMRPTSRIFTFLSSVLVCLLLCSSIVYSQTYYYSKSTGALNTLSTWGTNLDGTGTQPANFTANNQIFVISNNPEASITANWTVSGTNSKIVVGDGVQSIHFLIPENFSVSASTVIDVATNARLSIGHTTIPNIGTLAVGSTVVFSSKFNQTIPSRTYYNLHTEIGGVKTLGGNVTVTNHLRIGAITTLNGASHTLELTAAGNPITYIGAFEPATSTVRYSNSAETLVKAMPYHNLNISGGTRVLEPQNIIGVSGTLTLGAGPFTIQGSTVEFNGSAGQTIPAFTYYNLYTNNSAGLSVSGAVTVTRKLKLLSGIVTTASTNTITVTNPNANAVSYGSTSAFISGPLTRSISPQLSESMDRWVFPVGNSSVFHEMVLSALTTGAVAPVVTLEYDNATTRWTVSYSGTVSSVRVSTRKGPTYNDEDAIGWSATSGGGLTSLGGTVYLHEIRYATPSVLRNYYGITTRTLSPITYYYNGTGNLHSHTSWGTSTDGTGTNPPSDFVRDDATYVIRNTSSVSLSAHWTIGGHNTKLQVGNGSSLAFTVASGVSVSISGTLALNQNASVTNNGEITIFNNLVYENHGHMQYQDIYNNGTIDIYGNIIQSSGSFSRIYNNAIGVINLYGDYFKGQNTWFYNSGLFVLRNGQFHSQGNHENAFTNQSGGVVRILNSEQPHKNVFWDNINASTSFFLDADSEFTLVDTDMLLTGWSPSFTIAGNLIIQDGNFTINQGGLPITVTETGGLYMYDTNNNGDGVLDMNNGDVNLTVNGEAYVEGLKTSIGGGSNIAVNGEMFIGNVGLYTGLNNNAIHVNNGGILNYCGNKTPLNEQMGTVYNGGTLNYAGGYYTTETPGDQGDFTVNSGGSEVQEFEDAEACRAAFYTGTPTSGDAFLPIELSMLYAVCNTGAVEIVWQTASEVSNDYFTLYRSDNGIDFYPIHMIVGAGTSSTYSNYSVLDSDVVSGVVYYRLSQTDFDGTVSYSRIISLASCDNSANFRFVDGAVTVYFEQAEQPNQVVIISVSGQILYSQSFLGTSQVHIPLSYSTGMYIISAFTSHSQTSHKFIVD